jgi:hypothetical protein
MTVSGAMKTKYLLGALAATSLFASQALATTLVTTNPANDGNDGLMFDVKVGGAAVTFESLSLTVWGKSDRSQNFEIYTREGGIAGATGSLSGWTLRNTLTVQVPGGEAPRTFDITDFTSDADSTVGFYIRTLDRDYSSVMYYDVPGGGVGAVNGADDNISILSGYGIGKYGANAGRGLAGSITYTAMAAAVPEPATWAMMIIGFGLAAATLRRRSLVMAA